MSSASETCAAPLILQKRRSGNVGNLKKVISVIVEPSKSSRKNKSSTYSSWRSKYDLEIDGWDIDEIKDVGSTKNTLNLDKDINDVLRVYRFADVKLGCIKLTF